jgi:hypothetical protein
MVLRTPELCRVVGVHDTVFGRAGFVAQIPFGCVSVKSFTLSYVIYTTRVLSL